MAEGLYEKRWARLIQSGIDLLKQDFLRLVINMDKHTPKQTTNTAKERSSFATGAIEIYWKRRNETNMKKWFLSLESKHKTNIIIISWVAIILSLFLTVAAVFFSFVFIAGLVISILFTKWNSSKTSNVSEKCTSDEVHSSSVFKPFTVSVENEKDKEQKQRREEYLQQKSKEAQDELEALPRYSIAISTETRKRNTGYEEPIFSNITPKGKYGEFVVFDTETTGLAPSRDRIIELAAIRFVSGVPTEIFETFITPEKPISPEASAINHVTDEMVAEAPTISQVLPSLESFVGKSPLVAHNLAFDLKFIYYSGSNIIDTPRKYFDTLKISQKMLKRPKSQYDKELEMWETGYDSDYDIHDYKLETLADYYNITFPCKHRAAADAIVTGKLFLGLINDKQSSI